MSPPGSVVDVRRRERSGTIPRPTVVVAPNHPHSNLVVAGLHYVPAESRSKVRTRARAGPAEHDEPAVRPAGGRGQGTASCGDRPGAPLIDSRCLLTAFLRPFSDAAKGAACSG